MSTLEDRKWTIIGVVVAVAAILVSTWTAYDIHRKSKPNPPSLSILEASRASLKSDTDYVGMKLDHYLNGVRVDHVISSVLTIRNTGGSAIVPADFFSNLTVQAVSGLDLIGVNTLRTLPEGLIVKFKEQPNRAFTMEPVLLNSGDEITIGLLIDARQSPSINLFEGSLVTWAARVKDVTSLETKTIDQYPKSQVFYYTEPDSLIEQLTSNWIIVLTTYSAPAFFSLVFAFAMLSIFVLEKKGYLSTFTNRSATLLITLFILSMSTSEIIIFYIFGNPYGIKGAHYVNGLLIACHLFILGVIGFRGRMVSSS